MGKSYTQKYRLEVKDNNGWTKMLWEGPATEKNLATWVGMYIGSLKAGGVNEHISKSLGYMPIPNAAKIVNQRTSQVVARWTAPMFMEI